MASSLQTEEGRVAPEITVIFSILPAGLHGKDWPGSPGEVACQASEITEGLGGGINISGLILIISLE